uniref:Uncharacterized protein n=1 Tax=Aegilops tauschii subsp. strangulata TaxID=200361 RepID=A0A453AIX5_AEGTS
RFVLCLPHYFTSFTHSHRSSKGRGEGSQALARNPPCPTTSTST